MQLRPGELGKCYCRTSLRSLTSKPATLYHHQETRQHKEQLQGGVQIPFHIGWFKECPELVEVTRSILDHNEGCKTSIVRTTITQTLRDELRTSFEADDNLTPGKAVERVRDRYLSDVMEKYRLGSLPQASNFVSRGVKAKTFIPGRDYFLIETDAKNIKDKVNALAGGARAALYSLY